MNCRQECKKPWDRLPVKLSARPDAWIALRNLVNRRSLSDRSVCMMFPTGSGNMTLSTAWAMPCGMGMSCLSREIRAPLMVTTCKTRHSFYMHANTSCVIRRSYLQGSHYCLLCLHFSTTIKIDGKH
jgi:hypothetical protein